jgi:RNA polymerase sigma-70 factor (ECF subfamily)
LSYYLTADRTEVCYAKLSAALNLSEPSVKRLLHALRARYRALLREEVSETVMSPADLDDEIRHLCAALAQESRA